MAIGAQIRRHRLAQGLTLEELSAASGVEVGTISALENRDSSRSKFFSALAKSLGLRIEDLENDSLETSALILSTPLAAVAHSAQDPAIADMASDLASLLPEDQVIWRSQLKAAAERRRSEQAKEAAYQAEKAEMKAMMQALLDSQRPAPEADPAPKCRAAA